MSNRNISLVTLQESKLLIERIKKIISEHPDIFEIQVIDEGNTLIKVVEKEPKSDFFFIVKQGIIRGENTHIKNYFPIISSPKDEYGRSSESETLYHLDAAKNFFGKWSSIIKEYNEIILNEDPILKAYEEEFYSEYKILNEEADIKPFSRQQQQQLYLFLNCMIEALKKEPDDDKTIAPIILEIEEVKSDISKMSKNETLLRITKFFAKIHAQGIYYSNYYLNSIKEEGFKMIVRGTIEDFKEGALPWVESIKSFFLN